MSSFISSNTMELLFKSRHVHANKNLPHKDFIFSINSISARSKSSVRSNRVALSSIQFRLPGGRNIFTKRNISREVFIFHRSTSLQSREKSGQIFDYLERVIIKTENKQTSRRQFLGKLFIQKYL